MTKRLSYLILHQMRYVTNFCHNQAEDILYLPKDTCLISINNEHEAEWNLKVKGENVLLLKFSDVRAVTPHKNVVYKPMSTEDAIKIIGFLEKNKEKNILVNCAAGIARSGAIALFIHLCYGHCLKPNFWQLSQPNPFVLGLLITEFYRK